MQNPQLNYDPFSRLFADDIHTDTDGFYDFGNIASGTYTLTISKTGYETLSKEVVIVKGVTSTKNYFLIKTP